MERKAMYIMRKPMFAMTRQVTDENMEQIAKWCQGQVIESGGRKVVRVSVINARNPKQHEAPSGHWIVKVKRDNYFTYKIYTSEWLQNDFLFIPDLDGIVSEEDVVADCDPTPTQRRPMPGPTRGLRGLPAQTDNRSHIRVV